MTDATRCINGHVNMGQMLTSAMGRIGGGSVGLHDLFSSLDTEPRNENTNKWTMGQFSTLIESSLVRVMCILEREIQTMPTNSIPRSQPTTWLFI